MKDPIKVEKFTSDAGKCMTRLTMRDGPDGHVDQSVEELLSIAIDEPSVLIGPVFWHALLPWLCNAPEDIESFWSSFNNDDAHHARVRAVNGVPFANQSKERQVIGLAKEARDLRTSSEGEGLLSGVFSSPSQRSSMEEIVTKKLGEWVLDAVIDDTTAPKRLHEVLKSQQSAEEGSKEGEFFLAFVRLVVSELRLPTKKRVRHEAGLGDETEELTAASRTYRKLGLSGLPEG